MTKRCPHCHVRRRLTAFARNTAQRDGRASWCKACMQEAGARWYARTRGYPWVARGRVTAEGWPPAERG